MSASIIPFPEGGRSRTGSPIPDCASGEDVKLTKRGQDLLHAVVRGRTVRDRQRALDEWFKDEDVITEAARRVIVTLARIEREER
ncbi:hypothetical protein GXW71_28270 [Roseomonas hellenica]|uniref:Uncharacterized protein n=1 Tax=Plastoroseomonas hellenica TaxID=2687306 RepID=A0ABS5F6X8_9PROT|nr:hypothetical protein [Plastoroseomonas hellenica]MBR0668281.1 hypothetical protein [Plastoroseomonas hellenica]